MFPARQHTAQMASAQHAAQMASDIAMTSGGGGGGGGFRRRKGKVKTNQMGEQVYKGHPSHNIMRAMRNGIITSASYISSLPIRPLTAAQDFGSSSIRRKYRKSQHLKVGEGATAIVEAASRRRRRRDHDRFHFCDYNPNVFRQIRECFGIDSAAYIRSLSETWSTLVTPGKSMALLYFAGCQFVIKTLRSQESKFLKSIMFGYYKHMQNNPNSLLPRFYGHHCLTSLSNNKQIRFVVMNNVFQTDNIVKIKYDLKGSSYGREATEVERQRDDCIYKDNDFRDRHIHVGAPRKEWLVTQIRRDVEFLKRMGIMDYSMLLGIYETDAPVHRTPNPKNCFFADQGGMGSNTRNEIYYIGIIDILQDFTIRKAAEFSMRRMTQGKGVSAVPPKTYGDRFAAFMEDHIC